MCCPEAPGRPLSAGMPAPPAWAPSAVAPARNARSAFPPGPPAPQPWMRALHLQASWGGAAPRCPMQSSSRSRGVRASGSRRAPHRTARPPAQAFSLQQKWLRRGVAQAARGRFPCGCGGAAVVWSVPVPVGWSAVPEQVATKNRGMVPPVSALLAVGPLAAVGPWWLRRGRGGWSSTSLTPGDSDTW